jgi:hypothetical protein
MMAPSSFAATLPPSSAADEATLPIQTQQYEQAVPAVPWEQVNALVARGAP